MQLIRQQVKNAPRALGLSPALNFFSYVSVSLTSLKLAIGLALGNA